MSFPDHPTSMHSAWLETELFLPLQDSSPGIRGAIATRDGETRGWPLTFFRPLDVKVSFLSPTKANPDSSGPSFFFGIAMLSTETPDCIKNVPAFRFFIFSEVRSFAHF